ncbi:3057_t:CDS:2, partial [Dentiscutata erythropus]
MHINKTLDTSPASDNYSRSYDLNSKECLCCGRDKIRIEFIRSYGDREGKESKYSNCNNCARKKRKSSNYEVNKDNQYLHEKKIIYNNEDNEDNILYELAELEELVADYFTNTKEDQIKFLKNFELEDKLIDSSQISNNNKLEDSINEYDYSAELSLNACNELIEFREIELAEDKKIFEFLLDTVTSNIQNDNFYNTYRKLRQTLITEARACQKALSARIQQKTWKPP